MRRAEKRKDEERRGEERKGGGLGERRGGEVTGLEVFVRKKEWR